jgi:hypothetical protein
LEWNRTKYSLFLIFETSKYSFYWLKNKHNGFAYKIFKSFHATTVAMCIAVTTIAPTATTSTI